MGSNDEFRSTVTFYCVGSVRWHRNCKHDCKVNACDGRKASFGLRFDHNFTGDLEYSGEKIRVRLNFFDAGADSEAGLLEGVVMRIDLSQLTSGQMSVEQNTKKV